MEEGRTPGRCNEGREKWRQKGTERWEEEGRRREKGPSTRVPLSSHQASYLGCRYTAQP